MTLLHIFLAVGMLAVAWVLIRVSLDGAGRLTGGAADKTITTSELEQIVERNVNQATRPLQDRIDRLEDKVRSLDRRLPPQDDDGPLSD